jgi:hypothetical protein
MFTDHPIEIGEKIFPQFQRSNDLDMGQKTTEP